MAHHLELRGLRQQGALAAAKLRRDIRQGSRLAGLPGRWRDGRNGCVRRSVVLLRATPWLPRGAAAAPLSGPGRSVRCLRAVLVSVAHTSRPLPHSGVVIVQGRPPRPSCAPMPGALLPPGDPDAVRPRGSTAPGTGRHALQLARARRAGRGCWRGSGARPRQAFGAQQRQVNGGGGNQQPLVGADVGGGLGAADVLFPCLQGQGVALRPSRSTVRPMMRPGIWRTVRLAAAHESEIRTAGGQRNAQRLAVAAGDVGAGLAPTTRGLQHRRARSG